MKQDNGTKAIVECIKAVAQEFRFPGNPPRTWQRACLSTWLSCTRKTPKRLHCPICGRIRLYGKRGPCEQCARHLGIIRRRGEHQIRFWPGLSTLDKAFSI